MSDIDPDASICSIQNQESLKKTLPLSIDKNKSCSCPNNLSQAPYFVLAFYHFTPIENPQLEVKRHLAFLKPLDVKCRVYISSQGISAQMSFSWDALCLYLEWLSADPRFNDLTYKVDPYLEHVFPRLTVKFRPELVAIKTAVDLSNRGEYLSPEAWDQELSQKDENLLLIDVRNNYEWAIGHFEGADKPPLENFRDFPSYARDLSQKKDPQKAKVLMYCTAGIRCELYSSILKDLGFTQVYQLEGGVVNYGHRIGNKHWKGTLFVFDDRMSVPLSEEPHDLISSCHLCQTKSDTYYNCANMDCNALFLSCSACAEKTQGCCCPTCIEAPRVRPYEKQIKPKPFRKWYHYSLEESSPKQSCSLSNT